MNRNPSHNKFIKPKGYKDLGWQLEPDQPDWAACRKAGHKTRSFDNSMFQNRGTDVITICDKCKYVFHTDSSD